MLLLGTLPVRLIRKQTMRKSIAWAAIVALLAGCVTTAKFEDKLNSWVGHSEDDLVRSWGPPSGVYETANSKYLTYARSAQGYVPGVAPSYQSYAVGNTVYTRPVGGSPGFAYSQQCNATFELVGGVIRSWRWEGNACRSN